MASRHARRTLRRWRVDPDLASVRAPDALARRTDGHRKEWQALRAEVDTLLKKARRR